MSDRELLELAAPSGLGFHIEDRAGVRCIVEIGGGVRPASEAECALWDALISGQPAASAELEGDMPSLDDRATYPASQVRRLIREDRARRAAPVAQEPMKVPSDAELEKAWDSFEAEMARHPTDYELEEFMAQFADETGHIHDDQHGEAARALLARYGEQPAASAEPAKNKAPVLRIAGCIVRNLDMPLTHSRVLAAAREIAEFAAPVAQEPVSVTERWQDGDDSNMVSRVDTTAPVAAQVQPCNHVFEARPIDGSTRANVPCEPVCRKCGYRPAVHAAKGE